MPKLNTYSAVNNFNAEVELIAIIPGANETFQTVRVPKSALALFIGEQEGNDGREVEMQNNGTYIQWRYVGDLEWIDLVAIADLKGDKGDDGDPGLDGREIELNQDSVNIQWRYVGDTEWIDLIAIADLTGAPGTPIELRVGEAIQWRYVGDPDWIDLIALEDLRGPQGDPGVGTVPDAYGDLTDQFIADTEAAAVDLIYVVNTNGDLRADQNIPLELAGDQSRFAIGYSPTEGWRSYAPFIGPTPDVSDKLNKDGDTTTGVINFGKGIRETSTDLGVEVTIDLTEGTHFTKTITGATTLAITGTGTVAGQVDGFTLELTDGGTDVAWPAGITWAGGTAPELTETGTDVLRFYKVATTGSWRGFVLAKDIK